MVVIRPVHTGEHDQVRDVVATAFDDVRVADMVEGIRDSDLHWPELELVAVDGGLVVGHVMVSGTTLRSERGDRVVAMLTPLAVRPDRQGRGIGTDLVTRVLAATDARGEALVTLEGSPRYYGARGFVSAADHGVHLALPEWAPPEAAQVALLAAYDATDPTLRGEVVYPPAVAAVSD